MSPKPSISVPAEPDGSPCADTRLHEVKNWLTVLRGHLDLMAIERGAVNPRLDAARRALSAAENTLRDAHTLVVDTCDLTGLVRELIDDVRPGLPLRRLEARGLEVDLPPVRTDARAVRDIVLNLVRNAAEAIGDPGSGTVRVALRARPDGRVELAVEDDGPGMPAEVLARCFERGFSTKATGRGFGLARVAELAEGMGATLDVVSRPGRGTRVTLGFEAALRDTPELRVLVVDDDPTVREVLVDMLTAVDVVEALAVEGTAAARAVMATRAFDLVLLDRNLTDGSGDEFAIEVRQVDPAVAIVLLTGDAAGADTTPGRGHDLLVTKPIGLDALRTCLRDAAVVTRRRRRQDSSVYGARREGA